MTKSENFTKYILAGLTGLIVAALYAPIVLTIFYSFYKSRKGKVIGVLFHMNLIQN